MALSEERLEPGRSDDRGAWRRLSSLWWLLRRREVRFLMVGGVNTVVGLVAFAAFYTWWGGTLHYLGALALAYAVGIVIGFYLQRRVVFAIEGNVLIDFIRYTGVQLVSLALNSILLPVSVEVLHAPVLPAQVVTLAAVVVASYFGHLLFSFRRPTI